MKDAAPPPATIVSPVRAGLLALRVKDACRLTGIGRSKLYLLIKEGHISTVKIGSMTPIPMSSLRTLLEPRSAPTSAPAMSRDS